MEHYTLLLLLCGLGITPIQAQIKECEVLSLTDAIVIGEYLPCTPRPDFGGFNISDAPASMKRR